MFGQLVLIILLLCRITGKGREISTPPVSSHSSLSARESCFNAVASRVLTIVLSGQVEVLGHGYLDAIL